MLMFTVFGAPEWLSIVIAAGICLGVIYLIRRA
jgi:hypothetical protein